MSHVLVGDGHPLCRAGLIAILTMEVQVLDVSGADSFAAVLGALDGQSAIDLAVLDVDLPGMQGFDGLRRLRAVYPRLRIALLSDDPDRSDILRTLSAGFQGFIPKDLSPAELTLALRTVHSGQIYVPAFTSAGDAPARDALRRGQLLTDRQREVLNLLAAGRSNKEIGRSLGITEGTVKVHITAAFRQLGVRNRVSAASAFQAIGLSPRVEEPLLPGMQANERRLASH